MTNAGECAGSSRIFNHSTRYPAILTIAGEFRDHGVCDGVGTSEFGDHGICDGFGNSEKNGILMVLEPANSATMVFAMVWILG